MSSPSRFAQFAEIASDWWWEFDAQLNFTVMSDRVELLFGVPPGSLIGKPLSALRGLDQTSAAWKAHQRAIEQRRPFRDYEIEYTDPRGESRILSLSGTPLSDAAGRFAGYIGVGRDLTALRALEREAVARAKNLDSILEHIADGVCLVSPDLRLIAFNHRMVEYFGFAPHEVKPGDSIEDVLRARAASGYFAPQDPEAAVAERLALARTKVPVRTEKKTADGRIYDVTLSPLPGGGFVGTYANVTELRRREEELRHSQKMEAVGQLTGGVAHDFNNILTVILANVEGLEEDDTLSPTVSASLERISGAARRAADLTRQLLVFSRRQRLQPQHTDLNDLVASTGKLLRRTLGEHIEVETALSDDSLWPTHVDRAQFEAALVNLCVNARDAMPGGGKLRISTQNVTIDDAYAARHPEATPGEHVMLAVADTGTGIAPEILGSIFEPFFTTKELGKGTGLGLSMVYGFIKQSNGHIKVESALGEGTTFKIFLPRNHGKAGNDNRPAAPVPIGDERILVVEDDEPVREALVLQLKSLGYQVASAGGGAEGLTRLRDNGPFDLLLTDVVMPWPMNGRALAEVTRRRWPQTRVLFMSGFNENSIAQNGLLDPDERTLAKPFRKADLARAVRRALDEA